MEKLTGTVKWFDSKKGYGFITADSGQDVFVHYTGIQGEGFKTLEEGERVSFSITESDKGLKAVNVERL
ncbi:putative cold-shock DNA-binding protein [Thermovibrio guaymasensis]|uniref:Putative cold-shock DNA-binding protein n=1 Tax=Thermovibrio guaymasensis TaxID=240167 RepID=A0A420W7E5_9BACT|nr:cold-shock protein [Thermovibrio guaymasensis]RKQ63195.1 putative cold-shock DNA-binding protein [Thermovibrio guaymasensis]